MIGLYAIHIVLLALVVVLFLGSGRFSALMGDAAKGIRHFRTSMSEADHSVASPARPSTPMMRESPVVSLPSELTDGRH